MKANAVKLVTFQLGSDRFAADVFAVERVLRFEAPSAVPDVPAWIDGVIEYRNTVVPVVDMRERLGLPRAAATAETRTLVLTTTTGWVGAVVDGVQEVASLPEGAIEPPPALFRGLSAEFIRGVAKIGEQLVVVLEMERVLTSADRLAFEQAMASNGVVNRV